MREACYARRGDLERRLNTNRHQTTKQQGATDVTGQLRIIVLDTSPTTRKILEVILQREGHQQGLWPNPSCPSRLGHMVLLKWNRLPPLASEWRRRDLRKGVWMRK